MKSLPVLPPICCSPPGEPLAREEAELLAATFKALADPTRVAIVSRLAAAEDVCVCAFVDELELSQPTISHHLRILREAGLVEAERRGTWGYYRLVPGAVERIRDALGPAAQPAATPATPARARTTPARWPGATRSPRKARASSTVTTG